MPVEIRELVIRAVVEPTEGRPPARSPAVREPAPAPAPEPSDALVAACVKEVMRLLKKAQER